MKLSIIEEKEVSDETLKNAIEIRINQCWPALSICHELAGAESDEWKLLHQFNFLELLMEAKERKLPYWSFAGNVDGRKLIDAPVWQSALKHCPALANP